MSDPKRLLEENGDELENELLRSVRVDSMGEGSRKRILTGLGIAGAVVTTSSTAASSLVAAKAGFFKGTTAVVAKWVAISALAGLVPAGVWVARTQAREPALSSTKIAPPSEPKAATKDKTSESLPAPVAIESLPKSVVTPPRESKSPPPAAQPTAVPSSLSDEVSALQVARAALAEHDASAALAALNRYKGRFPGGRLAPEATVLRIEALVERGDRAQASALADRFESSNPKSPYLDRIRSILGHPNPPPETLGNTRRGGAPQNRGSAKDPGAR